MVGAVIVRRGRMVGQGGHRWFGAPHAEVVALARAGRRARGGTLYVTLEPCSTWGKQPPCVEAIARSGIRQVVVAMRDPNPAHRGRGLRWLSQRGIDVRVGVLEREARALNETFVKFQTTRRPWVTAKWAQSIDGKIATASGESRWISSVASRRLAHRLRSESDAVMVGVNTVMADDPLLTNRRYPPLRDRQPIKVVVDSRLRTSPAARVFSKRSPAPTVMLTTPAAPASRRRLFESRGVQVLVARSRHGQVDLRDGLRRLGAMGVQRLLIEGGGELIGAAFDQGAVDRAVVFVAPKVIGGRSAKTGVEGRGVSSIAKAWHLKNMRVERVGKDLVISGDT